MTVCNGRISGSGALADAQTDLFLSTRRNSIPGERYLDGGDLPIDIEGPTLIYFCSIEEPFHRSFVRVAHNRQLSWATQIPAPLSPCCAESLIDITYEQLYSG